MGNHKVDMRRIDSEVPSVCTYRQSKFDTVFGLDYARRQYQYHFRLGNVGRNG
jgi:hypothetical protein